MGRALAQDQAQQSADDEALVVMQDVARELRRPAYGGPLIGPSPGALSIIWLAVPLFDRGVFSGHYLARLSLQDAVRAFIPAWFYRQP